MQGSALSSVLLACAPVIDARRRTVATRLSVRPLPGGLLPDLGRLYRELSGLWSREAGPLLVDAGPLAPPEALLGVEPDLGLRFELSGERLGAEALPRLAALGQAGFVFALHGAPAAPVPAELRPLLRMALLDADAAPVDGVPTVRTGLRAMQAVDAAFAMGAAAVAGWPIRDVLARAGGDRCRPDPGIIERMLAMIDEGADQAHLVDVLRRDAVLAWGLLAWINVGRGGGMRPAIHALRHALMLAGDARVRDWLVAQRSQAAASGDLGPAFLAFWRRGEFLARVLGAAAREETIRDEVQLLGVFSMADRLLGRPFRELFAQLEVPERVREALVEHAGPYAPWLRVARALEGRTDARLLPLLEAVGMTLEECNVALVRTLAQHDPVAGPAA